MINLNTVGALIDRIREAFKETSDDSNLLDLQIYATMVEVRAQLLNEELSKRKSMDINFYQTICVNLCQDSYAKCCNAPDLGKLILRSTKTLPEYITHKYINSLMVTGYDGEEEIPYQATVNLKWDKLWDTRGFNKPTYDVTNFDSTRTLIVHNTLDLKAVLVTGAFLDPVLAQLFNDCNTVSDCTDWKDVVFPISSKLLRPMIGLVKQDLLNPTYKLPDDATNNAESAKQEY